MGKAGGASPLTASAIKNDFPFEWSTCWAHCSQYTVSNFLSEVSFFKDKLGFKATALSPDYAMFTSPGEDIFFSFVQSQNGKTTSAETFRLQFMIKNIIRTGEELEKRGVTFTEKISRYSGNSPLYKGAFKTPNGIPVDLWGMEE